MCIRDSDCPTVEPVGYCETRGVSNAERAGLFREVVRNVEKIGNLEDVLLGDWLDDDPQTQDAFVEFVASLSVTFPDCYMDCFCYVQTGCMHRNFVEDPGQHVCPALPDEQRNKRGCIKNADLGAGHPRAPTRSPTGPRGHAQRRFQGRPPRARWPEFRIE